MNQEDKERTFYDQDHEEQEQPLQRSKHKTNQQSKTDSEEEVPLRRHQAQDEQTNSILNKIKTRGQDLMTRSAQKEEQAEDDMVEENEQPLLSRAEQRKKMKEIDEERKAQKLGKKLNKVIYILLGLIVLTYLIMRFVNF